MTNILHSWTAIIPLRAGSKGLPNKNILPLNGKPLYLYTVDAALNAGANRIIISTDISNILHANHIDKINCVARPPHLCGDTVDMATVLLDLIVSQSLKGTIVLLQATSPLRSAESIQKGLHLFNSQTYNLIMGVTHAKPEVLKWGLIDDNHFLPISKPEYCFTNRQHLPEIVRPNGALYVFNADWFVNNGGFIGNNLPKIGALLMDEQSSLDIDNIADFLACEQALLKQSFD